MNTIVSVPPEIQQSFDYRLLSTPTSNKIYSIAAMKSKMPKNAGRFKRFSRYDELPSSMVPLGHTGVTPPSVDLSRVDIDVEMQFYGQWSAVHQEVTLQVQDPVLTALAVRFGVSMRRTEDNLIRDMLAGTAAVINCVSGVNGDNPTELSVSDIAIINQTLLTSNARTMSEGEGGSDKIGTAPTRNAYIALAHSELTADMNDIDGFIHSSQYSSQKNISPSEWGHVQNLRFFISSEGSKTTAASAAGDDVYNVMCCGEESYCMIDQDGLSANMMYRDPLQTGPLGLYCTLGWTMGFASRILNDLWVLNLRATRTN